MTDLIEEFFDHLASSPRAVLLLDYDGTLAPFRLNRNEAVPYPGVREILCSIQAEGKTRLAVISGRSSKDLVPLLAMDPPPEIWGSHGWERLTPEGKRIEFPIPPLTFDGLRLGEEAARDHLSEDRVERKVGCIAIHWRGLEEPARNTMEKTIRNTWRDLALERGLDIHPFDGGLELRVPGRHKGMAVDSILAETDPQAPVAYLGDDFTDEDAFKTLKGRGLGILVRKEPRPTTAQVHLTPPEELLAFLTRWRETAAITP